MLYREALMTALMLLPTLPAKADTFIWGCDKQKKIVKINLTQGTSTIQGTALYGSTACEYQPSSGRVYYWKQQADGANQLRWVAPGQDVGLYTQPQVILKHMAMSPEGVLYAIDGNERLKVVSLVTGVVTDLGLITGIEPRPPGVGDQLVGDSALAPDGTFYLATYQSIYTVDLATRHATLLFGPGMLLPEAVVWTGLAYVDGYLWASERTNTTIGTLRRIDLATGQAVVILVPAAGLNDLTGPSLP